MDDYKAAYEPLADKLVKSGLDLEAMTPLQKRPDGFHPICTLLKKQGF
jgi:hypothetical protein